MNSDNGTSPARPPRIVVVGAGFAGYYCLHTLERQLQPGEAELVAVNPTDYMLYTPLLPEVAGGTLDPRQVAIALRAKLPLTKLVLGEVADLDLTGHTCTIVDAEGGSRVLGWDRLVLTSGSVSRLLSIPGVAEHAKGFKSVPEGIYLRDHILRQLEFAEQDEDPAERAARATFVVVGAGYTGTEFVAQGQQLTRQALLDRDGLDERDVHWLLVDKADRVLPELNRRLSGMALRVLRERGVDVRLGTSVRAVTDDCIRLTDGTDVPTRTVVWCVGVRPDPLVESLGLPTEKGRLVVDERLAVPGYVGVYAAGDVAAVPDAFHPGHSTPMTAQHAQRQGRIAGLNVAASLDHGGQREYRRRNLGFAVDLAGSQAVADPLRVPISGWPAKVLTRVYHLLMLPANRLRVALDWFAELVGKRQIVQFGLVPTQEVSLADADKSPQQRRHHETAATS